MLQNPSADANRALGGWDFLFAIIAHLLIATAALSLAWWQSTKPTPKPMLKHIEVNMISAKALEKWQEKNRPKVAQPAPPIEKKLSVPPVVKQPVSVATSPTLKPKASPKKTSSKPSHLNKPKVMEDPNYDPFAPAQSSSDIQATPEKRKSRPDIATLMGQQLSQKELEQYISMMQSAVQRHWKVPGGIADNIPDPLVEMILNPNGSLVSVRILESSGDATFDQTLISAIHAAAPFQLPNDQFETFRKNQIRFHPL